jgi:hypothetical protein
VVIQTGDERTFVTVAGTWTIVVATPIGTQTSVVEFTDRDGVLEGISRSDDGVTPLINPVLKGNRLTWSHTITKPMKLDLKVDVTVEGDTFTGTSKAGMLPTSKITGTRAP